MHLKIKHLHLSQAVGFMGTFWKDKLDFYNIGFLYILYRICVI